MTDTLPTPQQVKKWDTAVEGGAELVFTEYLRQLRHRRRIETAKVALAFFGPVLGFLVVLAFLGTAGWLINGKHEIAGTFLGVVDIVSLAGVFVLGERVTRTRRPKDPN